MGAPAANSPPAVLIADPDGRSRAEVRRALERVHYQAIEAATATEALAKARQHRPALVVLDVHLPDMSGYELCRELREEFGEQLPIVFVSERRTEPADRVAGLLIGADDYLVKPFGTDELVARMRRLTARKPSTPPQLTRLTPRELEVLELLVDGHTQVDISAELYIAQGTVSKHIEHILAKLGVHSRAQAVSVAVRRDLFDRGPGL
jgi:two-component system nitrate/nitrite response regulator NarL